MIFQKLKNYLNPRLVENYQNPDLGNYQTTGFLKLANLPLDRGWWSRFQNRAESELNKMANGTKAQISVEGNKLKFKERIITNFGSVFIISIVTLDFPHKMPKAYVLSPKITANIHRYGDGSLCLMSQSSYTSSMSILQIRNLACAWCFCYEGFLATGKWHAAEH